MTIQDVAEYIHNNKKSEKCSSDELLRYINELEYKIWYEIVSKHYLCNHDGRIVDWRGDNPLDLKPGHFVRLDRPCPFRGYTVEDMDTKQLYAPIPYDQVYLRYVEMKIDKKTRAKSAETSENEFIQAYAAFENWYTANHMPINPGNMHSRVMGV